MPSAPHRLEPLDWLRGLMALSIMLYHLGGKDNAASLLGRLGIYGVSIFFILSGLSMAIAYGRYIDDLKSAGAFWIRRLFRIWPLLWLAVALVAIPAFFAGHPYSESMIALNLTTLFGFVAPEKYINQGAWSIGNEMVYYLLTPALIPIFRRSLVVGNLLTVLSTLLACMFAFRLLNPAVSLSEQWGIYINPMNNLFLYCAGIALYYNFSALSVPSAWSVPLLGLALLGFAFYPASGDQISLVVGINRIAMSMISIFIVFVFFKCPMALPRWLNLSLERLGVATYGVYLLHPIVAEAVRHALEAAGLFTPHVFAALVILISIAVALLVFNVFELPLIRLGKRATTRAA
jgi:exopolysaccharide production protein ExoZ